MTFGNINTSSSTPSDHPSKSFQTSKYKVYKNFFYLKKIVLYNYCINKITRNGKQWHSTTIEGMDNLSLHSRTHHPTRSPGRAYTKLFKKTKRPKEASPNAQLPIIFLATSNRATPKKV